MLPTYSSSLYGLDCFILPFRKFGPLSMRIKKTQAFSTQGFEYFVYARNKKLHSDKIKVHLIYL